MATKKVITLSESQKATKIAVENAIKESERWIAINERKIALLQAMIADESAIKELTEAERDTIGKNTLNVARKEYDAANPRESGKMSQRDMLAALYADYMKRNAQ